MSTLSKYGCLFFIIVFFAAFFLVLDSYLKSNSSDYNNESEVKRDSGSSFSLRNIYWVILVPLFLILVTIFVWCFYFRFIRAFMQRRKLIYVEVQAYNSDLFISRKEAKQNLNLVVEITTGVK